MNWLPWALLSAVCSAPFVRERAGFLDARRIERLIGSILAPSTVPIKNAAASRRYSAACGGGVDLSGGHGIRTHNPFRGT